MAKKPKIVIVGRPNVGKSTLFNKLSGKRASIVDQMEGVTRDRVYSSAEWLSQEFNIIDTGGYVSSNEDIFNEKIKVQISAALEECHGIIFLVDGKDGLNPNDQFLSKIIRKSGKKFVVGVNKCDTPEHDIRKDQFFDMGFENPIPISALNGAGVGDMLDNLFKLIDFSMISLSNDNTDFSIAIVGMPNVGKSSLLNSLIQREQAIVSDIAGTTRDSVDTIIKWHGKNIKIIDTAGLRKKSKVDTDIEFYSSLRAMDSLLRSDLVLLVVDAEKGFTKQEKTIAKEVIKKGKRMIILVNKWDLASGTNVSAELYKEDMYTEFKDLQHYPILFVSALTKRRVSNVLEKAWETFTKQKEKLYTKDLNVWIEKAVKNYPTPATQGKSIKIKFVEQVQQSPPIFALFSNYPKLISIQYLRYLHNQLRESFDLKGITIKFSLIKG